VVDDFLEGGVLYLNSYLSQEVFKNPLINISTANLEPNSS